MRKCKYSSTLHNRLLRGLALGCICISFWSFIPAADVYAAGTEEPEEIEEMEDIGNGIIDGALTGLDGGVDSSDSGEAGPDSSEGEMESSPGQVGCTCAETLISFLSTEMASDEEIIVYENLAEFEASTALVDRYQYELLKRLEFLQYSQVILISLIFVLIFKKK